MDLRKKTFHPFISSTLNKVAQSDQFSHERANYYLSEKYLEEYRKEDFQEINSFLDPKVMSLLGYEKK